MKQLDQREKTSFRNVRIVLATLGLAGLASAGQAPQPSPTPTVVGRKDHPRGFFWKSIGRGHLGVQVLGLTPELRSYFGAPEDAGVLVAKVGEGSPAAAAGIEVGDVLTAVDGKAIVGPRSLAVAIREKKAGEGVNVDFIRDKDANSTSVTVEERDRSVVDLAEFEVALPEIARRAVDVTTSFPGIGPLEGEHGIVFSPDLNIELNEEALRAFEAAMRDLEGRFESEEWQEKLKRFREMDLGKIQERMKEVEDRLRQLESELEKEGKKKP